MFETPVVANQLVGEPVEELGVGRWASTNTEVTGGFDQSGTEMMIPDPIDDDSGEKRVPGVSDPAGQGTSSRRVGRIGWNRKVWRKARDGRDGPWRNRLAWVGGIASDQEASDSRRAG